ncbi:MAG: hypothetical protein LBP38_01240 [Desulfovibrio sp.]|jgi:hypothetical protein|nr:hypothetical protein [Desulfovibrio sp.]
MSDAPAAAANGGEHDRTHAGEAAATAGAAEEKAAGNEKAGRADAGTLLGAAGDGNDAAHAAGSGERDGGRSEGKADGKETDPDPADKVPDTPAGYALTFADGARIDAALLDGFKNTAHAVGLTQKQSQSLAALYEKHVAEMDDAARQAQSEALDKAQSQWEAEIKSDGEFEENYAHARRALRRFGSPELTTVMNQTRIGSFPAFFTFVAAVGKALAEPAFKGAGSGNPGNSVGRILYPDMQ